MRLRYAALLVLLAGCQPMPVNFDVPTSQSYERAPADVWPALIEAVEGKGLTIIEADQASGRLVATLLDYEPKGWAFCKRVLVIDRHDDRNRRRRARPDGRNVRLDIAVMPAALGAEVRPKVRISERQINGFKNLPLRNRIGCQSTGELERELLAAISQT